MLAGRYEERAEAAVLRRLVPRLGRSGWFADFGGAYGRNTVHYRDRVRRAVIIDYSTTNLTHAAERHAADIAAGRLYLVRADLGALPFVDGAFESAMVIRVLHHLSTLEAALPEMARTVTGRWLLDIPIKHHALGRLRAMARRQWRAMADPVPHRTGTSDHPFWTFQLRAVRRQLAGLGFSTRLAASVNNFRRWDHPGAARPVRNEHAGGPAVIPRRAHLGASD